MQIIPVFENSDVVNVVYPEKFSGESQFIVDEIKAGLANGQQPKDFAILYRTNAQSSILETLLTGSNIPYVIHNGVPFFARKEVADLVAFVKAAFHDSESYHKTTDDPDFSRRLVIDAYKRIGDIASINFQGGTKTKRFLGGVFWNNAESNYIKSKTCQTFMEAIRSTIAKSHQRQGIDDLEWVINEIRKATYNSDSIEETIEKESWLGGGDSIEISPPVAALGAAMKLVYARFLDFEFGETSADDDRMANVIALFGIAATHDTIESFLEHTDKMRELTERNSEEENEDKNAVKLMTIHRCVHPDTLVETSNGLIPIKDIPESGVIGTPNGPRFYGNKITLPKRKAYKITTKCGYTITVSPEHGMTVWGENGEYRKESQKLKIGDILKLRLGCTVDSNYLPTLPAAPDNVDVRSVIYNIPSEMNEDFAEFLGMFVADGTLYKSGFRLIKRYQSVLDRFAELSNKIFGVTPKFIDHEGTGGVEVNSRYLSDWLSQIEGILPKDKYIPMMILQSSLYIQAAFLRGIFEDGTVNIKGNHVDHLHWENQNEGVAHTVQTMLLRFGIISSVKYHKSGENKYIASLYIYGQHAKMFAEKIGFVSVEKNQKLMDGTYSQELNYSIPITKEERKSVMHLMTKFEKQNSRHRGYLSRGKMHEITNRAVNNESDFIKNRLEWHFDKIISIEETECETMCVEVPDGNRFLQNGFDGWNSKGLEFPTTFVIGCLDGLLPHAYGDPFEERRLFYVAVSRAMDRLFLCSPLNEVNRAGHPMPVSSFFMESGIPLAREAEIPNELLIAEKVGEVF